MPSIIASNFGGLAGLYFGLPLATVAVALFSFWPAKHGHWSAFLLALPAFLAGALLTTMMIRDPVADAWLWVSALLPLMLAGASFLIWLRGRAGRRTSRSPTGDSARDEKPA